ncbi:MAG: homoaconitate hydratase [Anaerolineae bacterium]|nr:homoaconitate hydratase [Anaerolineae bacterium]
MVRVWRFGSDVDTDQIVPGRYAPYMTSEAELGKYPFIEARPEFAREVRPGDLVVAGRNFGCGSSREYAPKALRVVGVGAIIAQSFARIFFRNALNLGIPLFEAPWTDEIADGEEVTLDVEAGRLLTSHGAYALVPPPDFVREIWREGSLVAYYRKHRRFPGEDQP